MYTLVDPIIPWSERADQSEAEQSLVYKKSDFESDFEVILKLIAKQFRTGQAISKEFESERRAFGKRIWEAGLQKAESARRALRKVNLRGALSEKLIWKTRLQKECECEKCVFGKSNLKSDLDRRAFSKTAPTPRPARLKQRPHHLKRFWQAPSSDLHRFWQISLRFRCFLSFLTAFWQILTEKPKKLPKSLFEKTRFRPNPMCFCVFLNLFWKNLVDP